MESINTFLCKQYKKDTITIEDILPATLLMLIGIATSIIYIEGAIFIYNDWTTIYTQPLAMSGSEFISVMVCGIISIFSGFIIIAWAEIILISYILDVEIVLCKKEVSKND